MTANQLQESGGKYILMTALFMVLLQGANLVGIAINTKEIKEQKEKITFIGNDYVPLWFLEGLQKNNDYKTQEIIAVIKGDDVAIQEINKKYVEFQSDMLKNLSKARGGYTNIVRSVKIDNE